MTGSGPRAVIRAHRPRDGSVVSSLHCANDPQPEGHMASHIERRKFLATLGGAAVAWPLAARAQQQPVKSWRIGITTIQPRSSPPYAAFDQRLRQLGYI